MALDTKAWMKSVGFSDEAIARLAPELETVADGIDKSVLMRSDYSREMNKLTAAKTELATANDRLVAEMAEWAETNSADTSARQELQDAIEASEQKILKLTQKATRLAEQAGLDPKDALGDLGDVTPPVKKETPVTAFDPTPLQLQVGRVAEYMVTLAGELPAIADEHFRLTGERFDTRAFTAAIKADIQGGKATPESLDPVKRWEAQFDIPAKRTAAGQKAIDEQIAAARAEGRTAGLSEAALPGAGRPRADTHAAAFRTTSTTVGSKLQRPQPSARLAGAVAAINEGRYRNVGPGQKTA